MMTRTLAAGLAAVLIATVGCGGSLQPAGGTVSVDGVPVKCTGTISFYPVAGGRPAVGVLAEDGSFTLSTYKEGDGLPVGEYKVAIIADIWKPTPGASARDAEAAAKKSGAIHDTSIGTAGGTLIHVVPPEYNDIATTPHRETVLSTSGKQQFTIDIKTKR